jgi:hypothetical protein
MGSSRVTLFGNIDMDCSEFLLRFGPGEKHRGPLQTAQNPAGLDGFFKARSLPTDRVRFVKLHLYLVAGCRSFAKAGIFLVDFLKPFQRCAG